MSPALTRRGLVQAAAVVIGAIVASLHTTAHASGSGLLPSFDAEAFVTDLLAAGCSLSVHQPIGPGAGPSFVQVTPTDLAGTPTAGEREVGARWAAAMAGCPDVDERVLAVCLRRAGVRP